MRRFFFILRVYQNNEYKIIDDPFIVPQRGNITHFCILVCHLRRRQCSLCALALSAKQTISHRNVVCSYEFVASFLSSTQAQI